MKTRQAVKHTPGPLSCGCKSIAEEVSTHGGFRHYVETPVLCPLHAAAPSMYDFIAEIKLQLSSQQARSNPEILDALLTRAASLLSEAVLK